MKPPSVEVSQLDSTVITPQLVKFQAQIVIRNNSSSDLDFERVDYAVDLQGQELFASSFADMKRIKGRGQQTAMKDILDKTAAVLNTLLSPKTEFNVGGTIECRSPYGWVLTPIDVKKGKR